MSETDLRQQIFQAKGRLIRLKRRVIPRYGKRRENWPDHEQVAWEKFKDEAKALRAQLNGATNG